MRKKRQSPDFVIIERWLTNKVFDEIQDRNNIVLPCYCRDLIRNGMAIEAGLRLSNAFHNERIEVLLRPLTLFIDALNDESKYLNKDHENDVSAIHLFDIRLSKLRWLRDRELQGLALLRAKLSEVQRELVADLPTPGSHEKGKKWLRGLQEKLSLADVGAKGRPLKDRDQIYAELAWVWCEVGQSLIAKKNPTVRFVRFVEAITKSLPDLKLHTNLNVDIKRWYKEYQPLTPSEREANDRLAEAYRQGELKFRVLPLLSDGAAPRLRYDASRPHP